MNSIKTKLILALSILVIFLFSVTALLLINEKKQELSRDIYVKARSFSELTTPKTIDLYKTLLAEKSYVIFNREIKDVFRKDEDIANIKIYTFAGDILYNSEEERERVYSGEDRKILDPDIHARAKANMPSYLLASGRTVYLKKDTESEYKYVNENEKEVAEIADTDEILNIIYPIESKYAVQFDVTYENLRSRVVKMTERIVLLLIFGVLLGLGFGWYFSQRITDPIEKLTAGALVLGQGDFTTRVSVKTRDEVGVLAQTFNKMAQDLEASTKALVYKERVAKELEVAAKIQKQILPEKLPEIPGLELAAMLIPAAEIGGDCYDFIQVDSNSHIFYIGDVTGHGVPSGIVASIANALIYSYTNSENIQDILVNANRVLREKTAQNMFMTLLMGRYDHDTGEFKYVSAGHPEMLHYHAAQRKVTYVKGGGIALGMVPDASKLLIEMDIQFLTGDCVILYSDGIPEALSERGEQYGLQRLKRTLNDQGEIPNAEAIKNGLIADVKEFMGKAEQADDITLIVVRKK